LTARSPHQIIILGGFGFDNLGDDLILRTALAQLRETLQEVAIIILSGDPSETAAKHRGEIVILSPEGLLRQFILRIVSPASTTHRKQVQPIPGESFRRLLRSASKADAMVSLGGGYLNDYSKFLTHIRLIELMFLGLFRKPLILYSHEVGPLHRNSLRTLAKLALKFVTYATVRDEQSVQVLLDLGFPKERILLTADESWANNPKLAVTSSSSEKATAEGLVIALSLMPAQVVANVPRYANETPLDVRETNDKIICGIVDCLIPLLGRLRQIFFLSMSSKDTQLALRLQAILGKRISIEVCSDLDSQYSALFQSDVLFAMRMHPVVMAAQMNVPTVAIALLSKVRSVMGILGLSEYAVEAIPFDASDVAEVFNRALQNASRIRAVMRDRAEDLKQRARLNARTVLGVLKNR
jgi:polysaccharide pyruvyl transferase WcaK-like protein